MIDVVLPKIECLARAENYGRFVIEPLESGYGITLGNALRRILLSSLPGAAVTAIRMDGVYHEFSTIPHVKEDTTEIILNVKQIRLRCFADHPVRLYISAEGEGEITAGDIECPSEVEIINKGLHLLTLDSPEAQIDMELTVERGKGYVPAEQREGLPIGTIPVDAIFSPVRKVNFFTEHTRIGQVTTFDRLTMEIWVDGSIQPDEALSRAAGILVQHLSLVAEMGKTVAFSDKRPLSPIAIPARLYETPIEELDLSVRAYNCLKRSGISKVGQILEMNENDLLAVRNFGRKSLEELMERLALRGFLPTSPAQAEAALRGENNEEVPVMEQGEGDSAQ